MKRPAPFTCLSSVNGLYYEGADSVITVASFWDVTNPNLIPYSLPILLRSVKSGREKISLFLIVETKSFNLPRLRGIQHPNS